MKSQSLADSNMGGVAVGWSASERQVQAFLFRHVCRHRSVWTCFLQLVTQTHPNEHMASLALHMGMNWMSSPSLLEVSQVTHIPLPLAYEGVMALSSAGHSPQGRGAIPRVHPLGSPSKKASRQWFPFLQPVCKGVKIHTYSFRTNTEKSMWLWMRDLCLLLQWGNRGVLMCQIVNQCELWLLNWCTREAATVLCRAGGPAGVRCWTNTSGNKVPATTISFSEDKSCYACSWKLQQQFPAFSASKFLLLVK